MVSLRQNEGGLCRPTMPGADAAYRFAREVDWKIRRGKRSSLTIRIHRKLGVPGFDLEWDGNPDTQPSHTDNTTRSMLETYQRRHYQGLVSMLQVCAKR